MPKVESFTSVWQVTYLGRRVAGWAVASNERAVANARRATTVCSRRRVEREEVALYLAALAAPVSARVTAATHDVPRETAPPVVVEGVDSLSG